MSSASNRIFNPGESTATITTTRTLDGSSSNVQRLTASGGNVNCDLPAYAVSYGRWYIVANVGASNNIILRDAAAATVATLTPGQAVHVSSNGTTWTVNLATAAANGGGLLASGTVVGATSQAQDFGALGTKQDLIRGSTTSTELQVNDSSDNELLKFSKTASAVNEVTIANNSTGLTPIISGSGSNTNVGLRLEPKAAAVVSFGSLTTQKTTFTTNSTTGADTFTAAAMLSGMMIYTGNGASTKTTESVATLLALMPGAKDGDWFDFDVKNTGNNTFTLGAGTDFTLFAGNTNTVATLHTRKFRCQITSVASHTATIYAMQDSAH